MLSLQSVPSSKCGSFTELSVAFEVGRGRNEGREREDDNKRGRLDALLKTFGSTYMHLLSSMRTL